MVHQAYQSGRREGQKWRQAAWAAGEQATNSGGNNVWRGGT